jgi:hypothetical protein
MDRYYLPEIFTHTMDGLDLSNHIVATYYMKDRLEGEKFIEHFSGCTPGWPPSWWANTDLTS